MDKRHCRFTQSPYSIIADGDDDAWFTDARLANTYPSARSLIGDMHGEQACVFQLSGGAAILI